MHAYINSGTIGKFRKEYLNRIALLLPVSLAISYNVVSRKN